MAGVWIFTILVAFSGLLVHGEDSFEPMVSFICDRPAMYSTERGHSWIKDDRMGCLKDPVDILNYCRKVFPTLDIRNVVEGSEKVTVTNWCDFGVSLCDKEFTVTPYRCLVGPFQSDALLVPEHCVFDHIHDSKLCTSFSEWNRTSLQSCLDRGMVQQSFAMLQPCGIDKFNGVEFVCCPTKQVIEKGKDREIVVTARKQKPQQPAAPEIKQQQQAQGTSAKSLLSALPQQKQQQEEKPRDHQQWNEHEYYMKAKTDMQKHHHDKIAKMMKDWAGARQRVQEMRARDPKASEKLNKEITSRFQKMYEAEEVESEMEKRQLALLHQQRVQAEINEKKDKAFDAYVEALDDFNSDAGEILKSLKHYIKTLHKDRMHTINRYQHLEDTDPEEAERTRQETGEHLRRVDQLLTDALSMLNRVPRFRNKIMQQIQDFLDAYHSMDRDAALILLAQPSNKNKNKQDDEGFDDDEEEDDDDDIDDDINDDENDDDDDDDDEDSEDDDIEKDDKKSEKKDKKVEKNDKKVVKNDKKKEKSSSSSASDSKETKKSVEKVKDEDKDSDDDEDDENDMMDEEDYDDDEDMEDERIFEIAATTRAPVATETTRLPTTKSAAPIEFKSGFGSGASIEDKNQVSKPEEKKKEKKEESLDEALVDIDYFHLKGASADDRHAAAANVESDAFAVNQQAYVKRTPLHSDGGSINAAVPLGLAVAGLTVFIVIVVGVVLMRRRHSHRPLRRLGSLDLDPSVDMGAISPEERHVASMQMNGYENPTYKYFEQQSVSA